jgi:lysine N6-hydroxylase
VSLSGEDVAYLELYRVRHDRLAGYYDHDVHDWGVHIAIGPADRTGTGLGRRILTAIVDALLEADPLCRRVVAEPAADNAPSLKAFRAAGFHPLAHLTLPEKKAILMTHDHSSQTARRVGDHSSEVAPGTSGRIGTSDARHAGQCGANELVYDVVGVGCGPFNLGLAALAEGLELEVAVFDSRAEFSWHRGLMFDDAMLQVSFLADLVSLVEPAHPLSFLSYLRDSDRLYQFYVREQFHPTRREYEAYLRWAAGRLDSLHFGHTVTDVRWTGDEFVLTVARGNDERIAVRARHLVLGVGTEPYLPEMLTDLPAEALLHSGDYLHRRDELLRAGRVTVVGSGQSGAECALDLLRANEAAVSWLTRTPSFAPLDYSKLVLEMTTPSYVDYFHGLPEPVRDRLVKDQWRHYKGISTETLDDIHDVLYQRDLGGPSAPVELRCGVAVTGARMDGGEVELTLRHGDTGAEFTHRCDRVVAATGYRNRPLPFLAEIEPLVRRDAAGRWQIGRDHDVAAVPELAGRIFVSNADLHSHGVAAPDLGIGAVRNATILNAIAGRECFRLPKATAFTTFATPGAGA